jgi:hypothetical protein
MIVILLLLFLLPYCILLIKDLEPVAKMLLITIIELFVLSVLIVTNLLTSISFLMWLQVDYNCGVWLLAVINLLIALTLWVWQKFKG